MYDLRRRTVTANSVALASHHTDTCVFRPLQRNYKPYTQRCTLLNGSSKSARLALLASPRNALSTGRHLVIHNAPLSKTSDTCAGPARRYNRLRWGSQLQPLPSSNAQLMHIYGLVTFRSMLVSLSCRFSKWFTAQSHSTKPRKQRLSQWTHAKLFTNAWRCASDIGTTSTATVRPSCGE